MRHGADFRHTVRRGRRVGGERVVLHLAADVDLSTKTQGDESAGSAPRIGFVVSRAVGPAVTRNRVKRRLRHLVAARVDRLPAAGRLVVRALPASADATSADLAADLDRCLARIGAAA